ncbi:MAG: hypothetical protein JRH11_24395 [Deltaproteobacteria bacterium]|nr:hypothetical protein [Deltaproteobacteria bacterium]
MGRLILLIALLGPLALTSSGCGESPQGLPSADLLPPSSGRRRGPPVPEERFTGSTPARARIQYGPSDNVSLADYRGRGGGGGGGGGRSIRRPPGYPRGQRQTPEDVHIAAREVGGRTIRRGSEACELAYEAMRDLQTERRQKTPGHRPSPVDHDNFVEGCERRPEIEQWCLVPSFIADNVEECDRRAHTRYQSALNRLERQQDGETVDWAPAEDAPEAAEAPEAQNETGAPPAGPTRLTP